jgi:uncharacterized membrane protein
MVGAFPQMSTRMKDHRITVCFIIGILLLLLLPLHEANCQEYFEYNVQIKSDGSAVWTVTQFSSVNASVDTWEGFQERIFNLVDSAASVTHREMDVDENSLQINTTISPESKITEYSFTWQNFSIIQGSKLSFGDVFQVNNFFGQLYGDAALQLSYPSNYDIKSVYPPPYERQDSVETLRWSRTQDLVNSKFNVVLTSTPQNQNSNNDWQQYAIIITVSAVGVTLSLLGFYTFKRRKINSKSAIVDSSPIESEEDKVIKLLKSSGGGMRQSEITERCKFSKAKTSQLLAALEKNGNITRYKRGRDKIVTLKERVKSEKL